MVFVASTGLWSWLEGLKRWGPSLTVAGQKDELGMDFIRNFGDQSVWDDSTQHGAKVYKEHPQIVSL